MKHNMPWVADILSYSQLESFPHRKSLTSGVFILIQTSHSVQMFNSHLRIYNFFLCLVTEKTEARLWRNSELLAR